MFQITGTLTAKAPFAWSQTLAQLTRHPAFRDEYRVEDEQVTTAIRSGQALILLSLASTGNLHSDATNLRYTLTSPHPLSDGEKSLALQHLCFVFSLNDDLHTFYEIGEDDGVFASIIDTLHGLHHVKYASPFSAVCWAIMATRNSTPHKTHSLIQNHGTPVHFPQLLQPLFIFPEAQTIAGLSQGEIQNTIGKAQRSTKSLYLLHAASAFALVDPDFLLAAPTKEVERWLLGIKGVGAWSASFVLQRGLGRMEQLPIAEPKVSKDAAFFYNHGLALSKPEIQQLATRYACFQGYWSHYLRAHQIFTG